jgi:hypothetical protein
LAQKICSKTIFIKFTNANFQHMLVLFWNASFITLLFTAFIL